MDNAEVFAGLRSIAKARCFIPRSAVLACVVAALLIPMPASAQTQIAVNFAAAADYPLLKDKFNLYNTSIPSTADFDRDAKQLSLLNLESMRFEQGWGYGQTFTNTIGGTRDNLIYDWSVPDHWQKLVTSKDILIHWSYDYNPVPLGGDKGSIPIEPQWSNVVGETWKHLRSLGDPVLFDEVWNEADFKGFGFFDGTEQDFYALYARTARKLRELDKDAKIAGPTTAFPFWLSAFTDYVHNNQVPLDALTFHQYTRLGDNDHIAQGAAALARYPDLATVEIVLDEYHNFNPWPANGPQQTFQGATEFLYETIRLGKRTELTSLNWAQFQDPGPNTDQFIGLIASDGHVKATFNAFRLYGMMPVDSVATTVSGAPLSVMASADEHRGGVIVLNRTPDMQQVSVTLAAPPFAQGNVDTYQIDNQHNSWFDHAGEQLTPSDSKKNVALKTWTFSGSVPAEGTLAFIFNDGSGVIEPKTISLAQKLVRVNRYYPSRGTSAYADFDRRTWIARLGMVNETQADKIVGVTAEGLPPVLEFQSKVTGMLTSVDANSLLGVRLDFQVGNAYTRSVLFHGPYRGSADLFNPARTLAMPYGTKRQADAIVPVTDFADFQVKLADYSPPGASGRVQITYLMENTGPQTRAVIRVRDPNASASGAGGAMDGGSDGVTAGGGSGGQSGGGGLSGVGGGGGVGGATSPTGDGLDGGSEVGGPAVSVDASSDRSSARKISGCGCSTGPGGNARLSGLLLVALTLLRRRRHFGS